MLRFLTSTTMVGKKKELYATRLNRICVSSSYIKSLTTGDNIESINIDRNMYTINTRCECSRRRSKGKIKTTLESQTCNQSESDSAAYDSFNDAETGKWQCKCFHRKMKIKINSNIVNERYRQRSYRIMSIFAYLLIWNSLRDRGRFA